MKSIVVGGQAVIEGVMMKSPNYISIVVRNHKNKLVTKTQKLKKKKKWMTWPFIRGFINLIEMLVIGIRALIWSADQASDEEQKISKTEFSFTLMFSLIFAIGLFIVLPFFLTKLITTSKGLLFNIIDGIIRIIIFILYLVIISSLKDIKRIFEYHGAEHCAVNCYESGKNLTVQNAKKFTTLHTRCGTSFLIIVLIISILVFSMIPGKNMIIRLGGRIILLPIIAGISYEILKLSAKYKNNKFFLLIIKPGLWIQKMTTRLPSNNQIAIALLSLKLVLELEKK